MRYPIALAALALSLGGTAPASAADAPFSCTARAPSVCHFRIFYAPRGGRVVTLPAGTTQKVPGLTIGKDRYCVTVNKNPDAKCARKTVGAQLNS